MPARQLNATSRPASFSMLMLPPQLLQLSWTHHAPRGGGRLDHFRVHAQAAAAQLADAPSIDIRSGRRPQLLRISAWYAVLAPIYCAVAASSTCCSSHGA